MKEGQRGRSQEANVTEQYAASSFAVEDVGARVGDLRESCLP